MSKNKPYLRFVFRACVIIGPQALSTKKQIGSFMTGFRLVFFHFLFGAQ